MYPLDADATTNVISVHLQARPILLNPAHFIIVESTKEAKQDGNGWRETPLSHRIQSFMTNHTRILFRPLRKTATGLLFAALLCLPSLGQAKRKIIIDQDALGPAGTDQQSILLLVQSPETDRKSVV